MNLIKLRVRLRVATIKKASCARLRVRSYVELRSCGCGNSKLVASHALVFFILFVNVCLFSSLNLPEINVSTKTGTKLEKTKSVVAPDRCSRWQFSDLHAHWTLKFTLKKSLIISVFVQYVANSCIFKGQSISKAKHQVLPFPILEPLCFIKLCPIFDELTFIYKFFFSFEHLCMLILGLKSCFWRPTIFEIPQPNWYQSKNINALSFYKSQNASPNILG